ncbi:MAG: hypothetical protein ACC652_12300, partial [Acidimicrobiales bacterium]
MRLFPQQLLALDGLLERSEQIAEPGSGSWLIDFSAPSGWGKSLVVDQFIEAASASEFSPFVIRLDWREEDSSHVSTLVEDLQRQARELPIDMRKAALYQRALRLGGPTACIDAAMIASAIVGGPAVPIPATAAWEVMKFVGSRAQLLSTLGDERRAKDASR